MKENSHIVTTALPPSAPRLKRIMGKFCYVLGILWVVGVALVMIAAVAWTFATEPFWTALWRVADWYSPFNVVGFVANLVSFAPGLVLLWVSRRLHPRPPA